jgi:addiction module HigA family antidote
MADFPPVHPGEILREEFLEPMGISAYRLAKDINVPQTRIAAILAGERAITPDTALRLSRYFGMSERFWSTLQANYDLEVARDTLGPRLEREVTPRAA